MTKCLPLTLRKVSEKPPNKAPRKINFRGALRYTFELTDVAVKLLLGTKYRPVLFFMFGFKIKFKFPNAFSSSINASDVLMI